MVARKVRKCSCLVEMYPTYGNNESEKEIYPKSFNGSKFDVLISTIYTLQLPHKLVRKCST